RQSGDGRRRRQHHHACHHRVDRSDPLRIHLRRGVAAALPAAGRRDRPRQYHRPLETARQARLFSFRPHELRRQRHSSRDRNDLRARADRHRRWPGDAPPVTARAGAGLGAVSGADGPRRRHRRRASAQIRLRHRSREHCPTALCDAWSARWGPARDQGRRVGRRSRRRQWLDAGAPGAEGDARGAGGISAGERPRRQNNRQDRLSGGPAMRISHYFIDRPIFAAVVSVVFLIVGGVGYSRLPIAQYPEIAPPTINVSGQYPGANADIVASTVVTPIEQQINGVENMIYMSSNSTADGRFSIDVSFDLGTNLDIARVQVQNRVAIAQPRLPADVRHIGVTVTKKPPDLLLVVHLYSPDKSRDTLFISNYATLSVTDILTRIDGVGSITVFGSRDYAMRIWVDPDRLQTVGLTATDVVLALQGQNVQVASGVLDQPPMPKQGAFQIAVQTLG